MLKIDANQVAEWLQTGWRIKSSALSDSFGWPEFLVEHGADAVLLFGVEPNGRLRVVNNQRKTEPKSGWTVIALVPPAQEVRLDTAVA